MREIAIRVGSVELYREIAAAGPADHLGKVAVIAASISAGRPMAPPAGWHVRHVESPEVTRAAEDDLRKRLTEAERRLSQLERKVEDWLATSSQVAAEHEAHLNHHRDLIYAVQAAFDPDRQTPMDARLEWLKAALDRARRA